MYKTIRKTIVGILIWACLLGQGCATFRNPKYCLTSDVSYTSRYVAKDGSLLSKGSTIQPHINICLEKLALDLWGNYDSKEKKLNELDITLDYTRPLTKSLDLSLGYTYFHYPTNFLNETQEVCAGLSYSGNPLNANVFAYRDFVDSKGTLILFGLGKTFNLEKVKISPNVKLGYNAKYFQENSGFSHLDFGLRLNIPIGEHYSLSPFINHQIRLRKEFKDITYGGFALIKEF